MIDPPPAARMCGIAAFAACHTPFRFMSIMSSQVSSGELLEAFQICRSQR